MNAWVGPAIIAAVISSAIGVIGLYVNAWLTIRLERIRRLEKVRDVLIALRAEIRADINNLKFYDLDANLESVRLQYRENGQYVVRPSLAPGLILEDLLRREVQILPGSVIDPVVLYLRQKAVIDRCAEDMRGSDFRDRDRQTQLRMYEDYIMLKKVELQFARDARDALEVELDSFARLNIRVEDQWGR